MAELLSLFMRWLHISSMASLIGGILYARMVAIPADGALAPELRKALEDRDAARYRPLVVAAIIGLVLSGVYSVLSTPGHTRRYHVLLGIKLLLAGHVFASALLAARPGNPRRARQMTGALISGLAIVLIAAYLHRTF